VAEVVRLVEELGKADQRLGDLLKRVAVESCGVWYPAISIAGVRRFPPRVMRHTAASWLVQDGVPLSDVQALLGHESYSTTERYAHLAPDAHDKVLDSWARRSLDAPVTHSRDGMVLP
jgi:integrase